MTIPYVNNAVLVRAVFLFALDMTPLGWLGRKTSTQTNNLIYFNSFTAIGDNNRLLQTA